MIYDKPPLPGWIDTLPTLQSLATELADQQSLAVDTESNSLYAYREQVCLLQFSTEKSDYLVDPLALETLDPLAPIFFNPEIEKIFHAAEYDLICLKRDYGMSVFHIFDTMQAARILGYRQVGLDSMLGEKLGIKVDKKYQKADWGVRPLSPEMLGYARQDTHHLQKLRDLLHAELVQRGRWELAQEEFVRLARGNGNHKIEIPAWQRVKGAQKFSPRQLSILRELSQWREQRARKMDRPPFKVLDDRRLVSITQNLPQSSGDLVAAGLTPYQINSYGIELLAAVAQGRKTTLVNRSRLPRPSQDILERLNSLSDWRKQMAARINVESDIVLPKNWMNDIAEKKPRTLEELSILMPDAPWRLANFGGEILSRLEHRSNSNNMELD